MMRNGGHAGVFGHEIGMFGLEMAYSPAHIIRSMQIVRHVAHEAFDQLGVHEFHAAVRDALEARLAQLVSEKQGQSQYGHNSIFSRIVLQKWLGLALTAPPPRGEGNISHCMQEPRNQLTALHRDARDAQPDNDELRRPR